MRLLDEIRTFVRNSFIGNFTMQALYRLDASKSFFDQFSKVSFEAQLTDIVATSIFEHEQIVDARAKQIEAQIASTYPFSESWYFATALSFQLGDTLVFNPVSFRFAYPEIDASKQIISRVAVRQLVIEGVTKVKIYVVKANKQALQIDELQAFEHFIFQVGAAGTHFEYVSLAPDMLKLDYTVTYNPQTLSHTGERLANGGYPVNEAIDYYLENIRYGGAFNRTRNVSEILRADGVLDCVLNDVYLNGELVNSQNFESPSGFFTAQEVTISYIPNYAN